MVATPNLNLSFLGQHHPRLLEPPVAAPDQSSHDQGLGLVPRLDEAALHQQSVETSPRALGSTHGGYRLSSRRAGLGARVRSD